MRRRTEEKRLEILRIADAVFLAQGYAGAAMAEISRRFGGSKQTLYNYFASKEDLFAAVILDRSIRQADPLFARLTQETDLRLALTRFGRELLTFISSDDILAFRRIIVAEGGRRSDVGRLYYEHGPKRGWLQVADYFQRAMDDGRLRRADPWVAAMHLQGLCEAGHYHRLLDGSTTRPSEDQIAAAVEAAVDIFLRGYASGADQALSPLCAAAG